MADAKIALFTPEEFHRHKALIDNITARYHEEPAFRAALDEDAKAVLAGMGLDMPAGVDVKVVANTETVTHLVLPPDPNVDLSDESLTAVAGGDTAGTAGSAGTLSSFGSVPGTWSSAATAGTVGTAASGG